MTDQPAEPTGIPDALTIILRKPVTLGDTYTKLELREPTADEWARWDKLSGIDADIMSVSIVSGVPEPAVRMIGARDLITASRYLARFLD